MANDEAAWTCAVEVFERRIRERFLSCIEALAVADSWSDRKVQAGAPPDGSTLPEDNGREIVVPGFAIMALCCLLIETLQSFRKTRGGQSSTEVFKEFLQLPAFNGQFSDDGIVKHFVRGIRDGILHDAETRGWVIWRDEPEGRILEREGDGYALNRSEFYRALKTEFEEYLEELRDPGNQERRSRFRDKMDDIVRKI